MNEFDDYDEQTRPILIEYSELLSSKNLTIDDLVYVREKMYCVMIRWEFIGLFWGIHPDLLEQMRVRHPGDSDACLTEMIAEWLKNPHQKAEPTWKTVVAGMSARTAGADPAAAKKLAELCKEDGVDSLSHAHVPQADGVDNAEIGIAILSEVLEALDPVSAKWMEIGIILGLPINTLEAIKWSPGYDVAECVKSVVKKWLKKKYAYVNVGVPSWKKLVEAIGARMGGNDSKYAMDVAKKHKKLEHSGEHGVKRPHPDEEVSSSGTGTTDVKSIKAESDKTLEHDHHHVVSEKLKEIDNVKLISLGQHLGLDRSVLKRSSSKELLGDLIEQWIRRDGRVQEVSGPPTWRSLAKALQEVNMTGISLDIQKEFNFSLQ